MGKNEFFIIYFMNRCQFPLSTEHRCRRYQIRHHGRKGCCLQHVRVDEWLIEGTSLAYTPDLHRSVRVVR